MSEIEQNEGTLDNAKAMIGKATTHVKTRWKSSLIAICMIVGVWGFLVTNPGTAFSLATFRAVEYHKVTSASDIVNDSCGPNWEGPADRCKFLLVRAKDSNDNLMEYANIDIEARFLGINWGRWLIKGDSNRDQSRFQEFERTGDPAWGWVSWYRLEQWDWYPITISSPRPMTEVQGDGNSVSNGDYEFWKYGIWGVKAGIILLMALAFHVAFKLSGFGRHGWKALFFPITAFFFMFIKLPWKGLKALRKARNA